MMRLGTSVDIAADSRLATLRMMSDYVDFEKARVVEACVHAMSTTYNIYIDKMQQVILNAKNNPELNLKGPDIVLMSDEEMAKGTIIEDIARESHEQRLKFEQIMQEKYDRINEQSYRTTLKCRRCGSSDVTWEQKQTRGADEAMTVFCTCNKCKNRWTMK